MISERNPSLAEILGALQKSWVRDISVALPAAVTSYDATTQLVTVQPQLNETYEAEDGSEVSAPRGLIYNVPVVFAGGGGFATTHPIAVGDTCLLVCTDRSLDLWIERGGTLDPVDLRRHDISDAVALFGLRNRQNKLTEVDTSRAVFGKQGGKRLAISDTELHHGVAHNETATEKMILGSTYRTREASANNALVTALNQLNTNLTVLNTALVTFGTGLNAGTLTAQAAALVSAITSLIYTASGTAASQIQTLESGAADYLSNINKLK